MARLKTWKVSDDFWSLVEPIIPKFERDPRKTYARKPGGGRKRADSRAVFSALVFILRTGCIWNALPKEVFGVCSSTVHRSFQEWCRHGVFTQLWLKGLIIFDETEGVDWEWQSADGTMVKAPLAQESVGPNPTDRGKNGTKRIVLTDGHGVPLSLVLDGANRHDSKLIDKLLMEKVASGPDGQKNLCLDAAFVGKENAVTEAGYVPHIRPRGEEKKERENNPLFKARRWVVEACHSWFNRFRKLTPRYEKNRPFVSRFGAACGGNDNTQQGHDYLWISPKF